MESGIGYAKGVVVVVVNEARSADEAEEVEDQKAVVVLASLLYSAAKSY